MTRKLVDDQYWAYEKKKALMRGIFFLQMATLVFVVMLVIIVSYGGLYT